jgi:hypothetical protein
MLEVTHMHDTAFLGRFAKLEKANISFVMCVCVCVYLFFHMERLGCN